MKAAVSSVQKEPKMRYRVHIGLAFIVITLNSPGIFGAVQSSSPPGPYQQSCKEIEVKGHTLRARCPDSNGKLRPAELKDFAGARSLIMMAPWNASVARRPPVPILRAAEKSASGATLSALPARIPPANGWRHLCAISASVLEIS